MYKYKSVTPNPFLLWKRFFLIFVLGGIILSYILPSSKIGFSISAAIAAIVSIIAIARSYTEISRRDNVVVIQDINKYIQIDEVSEIKKWWNYDFGIASAVYDNGPSSESRMHVNNINCFVKVVGKNEVGYIYEQIVVSSKFPNHFEYSNREVIDTSKLVKVWNIDKCLEKLKFNT